MALATTTSETADKGGVFLRRSSRFVVGVDLGQSSDPTAISVIEHVSGVRDAGSEWERHTGLSGHLQRPAEFFNVRHLERLPLGLSYPAQVARVADLLRRPPLDGWAELVIDQTGVGAAVGDIFEQAGLRPTRVSITSGSEVTPQGERRFHVAKQTLISTLEARLHTGELRFAASLQESEAMRDELRDFRRHVGAAGRASYEARSGAHDDLVLSVAIACWWCTEPFKPPVAQTGIFRIAR